MPLRSKIIEVKQFQYQYPKKQGRGLIFHNFCLKNQFEVIQRA